MSQRLFKADPELENLFMENSILRERVNKMN